MSVLWVSLFRRGIVSLNAASGYLWYGMDWVSSARKERQAVRQGKVLGAGVTWKISVKATCSAVTMSLLAGWLKQERVRPSRSWPLQRALHNLSVYSRI
jgi:hypothetical protein